jgi:hypothetical protein
MANPNYSEINEALGVTLHPDIARCYAKASELQGAEFDNIGGYCEWLKPSELLELGFGVEMPPNLLPLVGNGAGDYLCIRWTFDGKIIDVVQWLHDELELLPLGRNITEALLLDYVRTMPEDTSVTCERWALRSTCAAWSGKSVFEDTYASKDAIERSLIQQDIAPCEVARFRCARLLAETNRYYNHEPLSASNEAWQEAGELAQMVLKNRRDLAWPFVVVGGAAELAGRLDEAVDAFQCGLLCSVQTEVFSWSDAGHAKICQSKLSHLLPTYETDYLRALLNPRNSRQTAVESYWLAQADQHSAHGDAAAEWDALLAAMYDLGAYSEQRNDIMARAAKLARNSGSRIIAHFASSRAAAGNPNWEADGEDFEDE